MPRIVVSTDIAAARRDVWRAIEDVRRHAEWMDDAVAVRPTGRRRRGVGATFEVDTKVGPLRTTDLIEITEWRPPRVMAVRHVGVVTGEGRFTLRRRGGRTRFTWEERLTFPWWMGGWPATVVATPVLRAVWRRDLRNLRRIVEGGG